MWGGRGGRRRNQWPQSYSVCVCVCVCIFFFYRKYRKSELIQAASPKNKKQSVYREKSTKSLKLCVDMSIRRYLA